VNWDYDYLQEMSKGISGIIKYGTGSDAHVIGKTLKSDPLLEIEIIQGLKEKKIRTQLVGEYNLPNVLAAVTVGKQFNVGDEKIKIAIENYVPSNSRSQLLEKGTNKIILDAYNANPSSMKLAIENFSKIKNDHKILMLGAMAELGSESIAEHQAIIDLIGQYKWKDVILVGGDFLKTKHPWRSFENAGKAKEWLDDQHFENTHFLIKGSRSTQMEKVIA
jgi:UDP-N-acetylmuramoyl-tripeptide--D-alanyl-D-alanine ligase